MIIFTSSLCLFHLTNNGQTIYGVSGGIKTPNAYIVEDGMCTLGVAYFEDYHGIPNELYRQGTININIGFHSKFELGARLAILPDLQGDSPVFDTCFDRILSGKFVIFEETNNCPQVAFGLQDIIGTRYYNSTYWVATKNFQISESFKILANLGYGTKLNDLVFGDAQNHYFIGFFGGTEIGIKNTAYFVAEYDAKNVNVGIRSNLKDWLDLKFACIEMKKISAGISLKFSL